MPCYTEICPKCNKYECQGFVSGEKCKFTNDKGELIKGDLIIPPKKGKKAKVEPAKFDSEGALCDVLTLLEEKAPGLLNKVDSNIKTWWENHQSGEKEKIKAEALAKLSAKERRALGYK